MTVWPGSFYPVGATYDGIGTNFSVFSEIAQRVELCLFDEQGHETRVDLPERDGFCWHGYLPEVSAGQLYGYRVHGPWDPANGYRCCPSMLLLDPYAKAIVGTVQWNDAMFPGTWANAAGPPEGADTGSGIPKSVVINPFFDWSKDRRPNVPAQDMLIYEMHVKGFTHLHPDIPENLRGTYAGLAHPCAIDYLTRLGITAVELLPVHQIIHERHLLDHGLRNYWGYSSIGYFAPHNEYSSSGQMGQQVQEFKQMVLRLHEAGIEVILDVVYNHTAEGNHLGPILSFKGIDNASYYRLMEDKQYYQDFSGAGNCLNLRHPQVLELVMDSLRYWVTEMHVDGFRFDLAATLARELHAVDRLSMFFGIIHQDPTLSGVKLIAEPWDVGEGGYQVGKFPPRWSELNGKYRDTMRDFWAGRPLPASEMANRFLGSPDLYEQTGRRPYGSVNFIVAHDGFTMRDLVTYEHKRNEANGEENRDGFDDNRSWNCGVEGETDDPAVAALRARQQRNFWATLLLSRGIPLCQAGGEVGHTQRGNNNAYCQDNDISWMHWPELDAELLQFVRDLIGFRKKHPVFYRRILNAATIEQNPIISTFSPDGSAINLDNQPDYAVGPLAIRLSGQINQVDERGRAVVDDDFLILFNPGGNDVAFVAPGSADGETWAEVIDTTQESVPLPEGAVHVPGQSVTVSGHSMKVLCHARQP